MPTADGPAVVGAWPIAQYLFTVPLVAAGVADQDAQAPACKGEVGGVDAAQVVAHLDGVIDLREGVPDGRVGRHGIADSPRRRLPAWPRGRTPEHFGRVGPRDQDERDSESAH